MKNLALILLFSWGLVQSNFAQGQINFNNQNALTDPSYGIYYLNFGQGPGAGWTAQLFLVSDQNVLTPLTPATGFFTEPGSQFLLQPVDIVVPEVGAGTTATFTVRVWDSVFASYDAAVAANGRRGQSLDFNNKLGGGTLPLENTVFPGFTIMPEPSTIALGLLGAGALLLRRRK